MRFGACGVVFKGWGSLYKHQRITLGKNFAICVNVNMANLKLNPSEIAFGYSLINNQDYLAVIIT